MRLRPLLNSREVVDNALLLGIGAPRDAGELRRSLAPARALVGERHRQIVMHGDDDVAVDVREVELVQMMNAIPESGSNNDVARGVGLTNQRERLMHERVPACIG